VSGRERCVLVVAGAFFAIVWLAQCAVTVVVTVLWILGFIRIDTVWREMAWIGITVFAWLALVSHGNLLWYRLLPDKQEPRE